MPGITLAKIYKFWGNRLLERNVRVFLQAKGKVNKGIRSSIEKNPSMFFSYNNGITATASKIEKEPTKMGFTITGITDFQIEIFNRWGQMVFKSHSIPSISS